MFVFDGAALAQDKVRAELESLHTKWFAAHDQGDGAAMNRIEVDNLVLVLPDGSVFKKEEPRPAKHEGTGVTSRALSDLVIRRFGDTAIMTGILITQDSKGSKREATTVVWIRQKGTWRVASAQWAGIPASSH